MGNRFYVRGASKGTLEQKDQDAITVDQLVGSQRQVKIGDTINVKTNKCCSVDEGMSGKSGVWRKGTNRDRHFSEFCPCTASERCV